MELELKSLEGNRVAHKEEEEAAPGAGASHPKCHWLPLVPAWREASLEAREPRKAAGGRVLKS